MIVTGINICARHQKQKGSDEYSYVGAFWQAATIVKQRKEQKRLTAEDDESHTPAHNYDSNEIHMQAFSN